jgi:arabinoxylan arabinofuranohydrolase
MRIRTITLAVLTAFGLQLNAQTLVKEFKGLSNGNPISGSVFCADPTALEYNGRLYVYGTNDSQEFVANGKKGDNTYGKIKSLVVFSTDDMVNWTFHGTIDVKKICSWSGNSWAPSAVWRTNPKTGEDEFFIYFANGGSNVGVLKSTVSPVGPFKSPNSQAMVNHGMPGVDPCTALFDPGAVIDENGTGWITVGGYSPNAQGTKLQPNNVSIIKLKPSMTAIDGSAVKIPAPYHFEANELNVIGGKYVFTYCSHWDRSEDEWNAYKKEHNISVKMPGIGTMCYMVSDTPMDPNSWVFKGAYGPGVSGNNHSHLQKFKGNYYHIYHDHGSVLLDVMKSAGAVDKNAGDFRSICVNKATVDESTGTVNPVTLNIAGVEQIKSMNPYELQQAETMATCGGIEYEDFTNIKKNTKISTLGNDATENMQVRMRLKKNDSQDFDASWIQVRKVDFGSQGASKLMVRAKGEGTLEFRFGRKGAKPSAVFDIVSDEMKDYTIDVNPTDFLGSKTIYIAITSGTAIYFDAWQATEAGTDGIEVAESGEAVMSQRFDLSGRNLGESGASRGIVIEQYQDAKGKKYARKRVQ